MAQCLAHSDGSVSGDLLLQQYLTVVVLFGNRESGIWVWNTLETDAAAPPGDHFITVVTCNYLRVEKDHGREGAPFISEDLNKKTAF